MRVCTLLPRKLLDSRVFHNRKIKKVLRQLYQYLSTNVAEGAGFEPAWTFALTVFKTAPL